MTGPRQAFAICALVVFFAGASATADAPHFAFDGRAGRVVARLSISPGELAGGSRSVVVYGDGLVRAHYPAYLENAGDRETRLSAGELQTLVSQLASSGLPEFDESSVRAECEAAQAATGELFEAIGADRIEIELNLNSYRRRPGDVSRSVQQRVRWRALPQDALRFPQIRGLAALLQASESLEALLRRDDLRGSQ
jgi:hypothetical protein